MKTYVIATYATERYVYALPNFGRRVSASILDSGIKKGTFLFIGDKTEKIKESALLYIGELLPNGWDLKFIALPLSDKDLPNYKESAQLLIAQMQSCAFTQARLMGADYFWSLESDVLIPPNAFSVSLDCLRFDKGYYDVVMCTYPSQGGGAFLGGRGTYQNQIAEDFSMEERELPKGLDDEIKKREEQSSKEGFKPTKKWLERAEKIAELIKSSPPKGNVFEVNSKGWKRRGWMEYAYPAIGKGAILPTDWVGFGCTMMSKKALSLAHFDGYEGKGTQDLFIGWNCWKPNGIKMCVTTHVICDHIIRKRNGDDQLWDNFTHVMAFHEPEGDCEGHLRQRHLGFYNFTAGEKVIEEIKKDSK